MTQKHHQIHISIQNYRIESHHRQGPLNSDTKAVSHTPIQFTTTELRAIAGVGLENRVLDRASHSWSDRRWGVIIDQPIRHLLNQMFQQQINRATRINSLTSQCWGKNNLKKTTNYLMLLPPDEQPYMLQIFRGNLLGFVRCATESCSDNLSKSN